MQNDSTAYTVAMSYESIQPSPSCTCVASNVMYAPHFDMHAICTAGVEISEMWTYTSIPWVHGNISVAIRVKKKQLVLHRVSQQIYYLSFTPILIVNVIHKFRKGFQLKGVDGYR